MEQLKKGDPCPCCGRPIKTDDPDVLRLLTWIKREQAFPSREQIAGLLKEGKTE